jgi:glutamate formiminotransferase
MTPCDYRANAVNESMPPARNPLSAVQFAAMCDVIECVVNISEGRRADVIDELAEAIQAVSGLSLVDRSTDASHNRSVFTVIGNAPALRTAVVALYRVAIDRIDLRQHQGVHPRMGAVDVVPFVPLANTTMETCVELATDVAEELAVRFSIPIYLYGEAARRAECRALEAVRGKGLEDLAERMAGDEWHPDFGPPAPHPTAGASAVGARPVLIAFNVSLDTTDIDIARQVARAIRERDGGLRAVKALGLRLETRGLVQVSMNLVDYRTTPLHTVYERVRAEAALRGVRVAESELIGLAPADALLAAAGHALNLARVAPSQVIEAHLDRASGRGPRPAEET